MCPQAPNESQTRLLAEGVGVYLTQCPLFVFRMKTRLMNVGINRPLSFYISHKHGSFVVTNATRFQIRWYPFM